VRGLNFPTHIEGGKLPIASDLLWVCYTCGQCKWTSVRAPAWDRVMWHDCIDVRFVRRMHEATDREYAAGRAAIKV
jgi:hypothetical protein